MENKIIDLSPASDDSNQLSFQFGKNQVDFKENSFQDLYFESTPLLPSEEQRSRFFAFSTGLHILAIIGMSFVTLPLLDKKIETITVEIEAPAVKPPPPLQRGSLAGAEIPAARGTPHRAVPVVKAAKVRSASKAAAKAPKIASHSTADKTQVFQAPAIPEAVAMNASIDDISAPDLDDSALKASSVGQFDSKDLSQDFEKIDRKHQKAASQEADKLNALADQLSADEEKQTAGLKDAMAAENARIASLNKSRRAGELSRLAAAGNGGQGTDASTRNKVGGSLGASQGSAQGQLGGQPGGAPQGIRKLENLRQMPGNPRPQYDTQERMRGDHGMAVFYAYITAGGVPTQFKMARSTGFRNLDAKTLVALKKWRFYPGQEGWVELPFRWDIRGGSQEKPTLLRRSNAGL